MDCRILSDTDLELRMWVSMSNAYLACTKLWFESLAIHAPSVVVSGYNPGIGEVETGESEGQSHLRICYKLESKLGYIRWSQKKLGGGWSLKID